ncbi:hypothetical protein B0T16DRAFT_387865 [Cercophora newfieldiana]|uniref:Heterokaryon incompatibility domain-containing protein n=1 Tax=Cercophora newfieldiana TaxID=92897 RepID=A0AA39YHC5_9PEZI|nr:hypothetical protein B0T16DRAFT_387865 [Cercophora newfieldiana]
MRDAISLCKICLRLFGDLQHRIKDEGRADLPKTDAVVRDDYHPDIESWQSAVQAGCNICQAVRDALPPDLLRVLGDQALRESLFETGKPILRSTCRAMSHRANPVKGAVLQPEASVLNDSGPIRSWTYVDDWLHSCVASHSQCRPANTGEATWYPTRLLDIGAPKKNECDDNDLSVRLIDTALTTPIGPYVTLSHRWASSGDPVLTTTDNIEAFKGQVPRLPKTFRDAIKVTQERLLSPRVIHFARRQLYWECNELWANETDPDGFTQDPDADYDTASRAKKEFSLIFSAASWPQPNGETAKSPPEEQAMDLAGKRSYLWQLVVRWYTPKALSFDSDRLPALSGIAKYLQPYIAPPGAEYLAGIWRHPLTVLQLSWGTKFPSAISANHSDTKGTPTWSWAVTNNRQVWFACHICPEYILGRGWKSRLERRCTILDAQTTLATADPMGSVSGGFLLLEGHMNRVFLSTEKSHFTCAPDNARIRGSVYLDRQGIDSADELYLFSLCSTSECREGLTQLDHFSYLILSPVRNGGQTGVYERCGLMWSSHAWYNYEERDISQLWETRAGQDGMIPSEGGFDPEKGYRIRVI